MKGNQVADRWGVRKKDNRPDQIKYTAYDRIDRSAQSSKPFRITALRTVQKIGRIKKGVRHSILSYLSTKIYYLPWRPKIWA